MLGDYRPKLILNRVRARRHIAEVHRFIQLVRQYLSTEVEYVGYVRNDDKMLDACEKRRPVVLNAPKSGAALDLYSVIMNGLGVSDRLHRFEPRDCPKSPRRRPSSGNAPGLPSRAQPLPPTNSFCSMALVSCRRNSSIFRRRAIRAHCVALPLGGH